MKNEGFDNKFSNGRNILTNNFFNKYENSSRAEVLTERLLSDSLDDVQRPITEIHANPLNSVII
jgi:hypothetical protein